MKKINIGLIVRTYEEDGGFYETRKSHMPCKGMPKNIMKDLIAGEVVCVQVTPNVEAFYFEVPKDWPENWTTLKDSNEKQFAHEE